MGHYCQHATFDKLFGIVGIALAGRAWKHPKYPWFCILPLEFGVNIDIQKHENSEVLCSNRNKSSKKMPRKPWLQIHENILIDFIWLNVQTKSLIQTILYQSRWGIALWKSPQCPQSMQWTWWQTLTTQHTGLRVLVIYWVVEINITSICNRTQHQNQLIPNKFTLMQFNIGDFINVAINV